MSVKCIDPFAGGEKAIFFSGHGILDLTVGQLLYVVYN